jgi:hypothetical protein
MTRTVPDPTPKHRWIESIQGPIVFIPNDLLPHWPGIEPGDEWPGTEAVDGVLYSEAVGAGIALLLHSNYSCDYTTWEPLPNGGGVLVQDVAYKGDAAAEALVHVPEPAWQMTTLRFRVGSAGATLFDGAWPGPEWDKSGMAVDLAGGAYSVEAIAAFVHANVTARYVRLKPAG